MQQEGNAHSLTARMVGIVLSITLVATFAIPCISVADEKPTLAQSPPPADVATDQVPAELKPYIGKFGFKSPTFQLDFELAYVDGALKVVKFVIRDRQGQRDRTAAVQIRKAESGPGFTIVGTTEMIDNLVPQKDGKVLVGTVKRVDGSGTPLTGVVYWRE